MMTSSNSFGFPSEMTWLIQVHYGMMLVARGPMDDEIKGYNRVFVFYQTIKKKYYHNARETMEILKVVKLLTDKLLHSTDSYHDFFQ